MPTTAPPLRALQPAMLPACPPAALALWQAAHRQAGGLHFAAGSASACIHWVPRGGATTAGATPADAAHRNITPNTAAHRAVPLQLDAEPITFHVRATAQLDLLLGTELARVPAWLLPALLIDHWIQALMQALLGPTVSVRSADETCGGRGDLGSELGSELCCELGWRLQIDGLQLDGWLATTPAVAASLAAALADIADRAQVHTAAHTPEHTARPAPSGHPLDALSLPLPLRLAGPRLSLAECRALAPDDLVMLPRSPHGAWAAQWQALDGRVLPCGLLKDLQSIAFQEPLAMNEFPLPWHEPAAADRLARPSTEDAAAFPDHGLHASATPVLPPAPAGAHAADGDPFDQLQVQLGVSLGQVPVRLGLLRQVQAGYVLPLSQPVHGAEVELLANGQPFAQGELVALGERLALRLTRLVPSALPSALPSAAPFIEPAIGPASREPLAPSPTEAPLASPLP